MGERKETLKSSQGTAQAFQCLVTNSWERRLSTLRYSDTLCTREKNLPSPGTHVTPFYSSCCEWIAVVLGGPFSLPRGARNQINGVIHARQVLHQWTMASAMCIFLRVIFATLGIHALRIKVLSVSVCACACVQQWRVLAASPEPPLSPQQHTVAQSFPYLQHWGPSPLWPPRYHHAHGKSIHADKSKNKSYKKFETLS